MTRTKARNWPPAGAAAARLPAGSGKPTAGIARVLLGGHFNPVRQAFAGFAPFQPESRPMRGGALLVNPPVRA
jgi:hypothetical protein